MCVCVKLICIFVVYVVVCVHVNAYMLECTELTHITGVQSPSAKEKKTNI